MNILNKNNNKNWTSKKNNKNCKGITEINNNILTLLMCETDYKDAIRI